MDEERIMKAFIMSLVFSFLLILAGSGIGNALQDPYPLNGYVTDVLGANIEGANISFTNINNGETIYINTYSDGYYVIDCGYFTSGYSNGDIIQYNAEYNDSINSTFLYTINSEIGFHKMNMSIYTVIDTDNDGVPNAWDKEPDTPIGYMTDSNGYGLLWGDMNRDGKLSSVDALMILQIAVR